MTPDSASALRVLVVDDHEVVRRGLLAFLESEADLEVVGVAAGGQEALEFLGRLDSEERRPDLILMDLKMAPMDGIEATRRIRAGYPDVEVVALTSFPDKERVSAALEAGAAGYILKDANPDEITAALRAAHRGELHLDPAVTRQFIASLTQQGYDLMSNLTPREREVLRLVSAGKTNKEIARELVISERTARTHVSKVIGKLGVTSRTQAALLAVREGLVPPPDSDEVD